MMITQQLLEAAIEYARSNGARYVEAYLDQPDSPSYLYIGFIPTFEKAGFKFIKKAEIWCHVMLLEL
jgi:hypothetical protein